MVKCIIPYVCVSYFLLGERGKGGFHGVYFSSLFWVRLGEWGSLWEHEVCKWIFDGGMEIMAQGNAVQFSEARRGKEDGGYEGKRERKRKEKNPINDEDKVM